MNSAAAPEPVKPNLEADDVLPAALPPFDIGVALDRLNGDTLLLRRLLILFHDTYVDLIPNLSRLMADGAYDEARRLTHTLKGGAGNLAVEEVYQATKLLEDALATGNAGLVPESIPELINNLEAVLAPAIAATASLKPEKPAPAISNGGNTGKESVLLLLSELDELLASRNMKARRTFAEFRNLLSGRDCDTLLRDMAAAIDRMDYGAAQSALAELSGKLGIAVKIEP